MKLRAVATLWLSNPQRRHPVCTVQLPWLLWLNTQRDQLYWQGHVPAHWSLWGAWTHTHPGKLTRALIETHVRRKSVLTHSYILRIQASRTSMRKRLPGLRADAHVYARSPSRTQTRMVLRRHCCDKQRWDVGGWCGVWMGFSVLQRVRRGLTTHHFPLAASRFVCVSPRGNFGPFIMSVCAPVPSDTRVYLRHVCRARMRVIMPGLWHAPPYSSSFQVLSMEGFITLFWVLVQHSRVMTDNLPGSHALNVKGGEDSAEIHWCEAFELTVAPLS